jgi:hypothetical protein
MDSLDGPTNKYVPVYHIIILLMFKVLALDQNGILVGTRQSSQMHRSAHLRTWVKLEIVSGSAGSDW